jgi:3-deoxy-D-manno-octulosonic-acid transferase
MRAEQKERGSQKMIMLVYSALLTLALLLSAPWWLLRMATTERYREGLRQRLGSVPAHLIAAVQNRRVVWVHAVSVGELLAASRLVGELEVALGDEFLCVISTTTRTAQTLAKQRFGAERVFYMPLDFAFAVRAYLDVLRPAALILMESELWPRMLYECGRRSIPVAVANARMSDRSFARAMRMQAVWGNVMRRPTRWIAQTEDDALRLVILGARTESVQVAGNMKFDILAPEPGRVTELIREAAQGRKIIVAGSTVGGANSNALGEDEIVVKAWEGAVRAQTNSLLVLAPRHPERFDEVYALAMGFRALRATQMIEAADADATRTEAAEVVVLDTIGDLGSVYSIADVAFVGASLVKRGGHNPLEPAQFAVPVVMGTHWDNFRDAVYRMQAVAGIRILERNDKEHLEKELLDILVGHPREGRAMGARGRRIFEDQQGATGRAVKAIVAMIQDEGL